MSQIRVLLVEQEEEKISLISLLLSEIKECSLEICTSGEEALSRIPDLAPDLILVAYGLVGLDGRDVVRQIRKQSQTAYIVVSLPESDLQLIRSLMMAGANDCVMKDKNYVSNLMIAAKKGLIRISERRAFSLPPLAKADQLALDDVMPDIVFTLDEEGNFLYTSRAIADLLGFDQKDVVRKSFLDLVAGKEEKSKFEHFVKRSEPQVGFRQILTLKNKKGTNKNFEVNCSLDVNGIYGVLRPVHPVPEDSRGANASDSRIQSEEQLPRRIGAFQIITLLGAGSMGRVYKGYDEQLERYVAIKLVSKARAADAQYVERFHREAKILASIVHPNIALIYFYGNLEGVPYFCMEYMPGGSLESLLVQKAILEPELAVSYTLQTAIGLSKALEKGVVHLDVKPSNLMLAENDRIKVVDFGLARTRNELESIHTKLIGTPLYIAPEQIHGGVVDFRCDIYSLGLTFFQLLYGSVPHAAKTVQEVFRRRVQENIPSVESLNREVPPRLHEIISRMTHRDPSRRYGNYSELIEDLEQSRRNVLDLAPDSSPPGSSTVRMSGALYDLPFAEVLGEIFHRGLSGKLTLSWIDLVKNIHFKNGRIRAVLSNQEGESFVDLLLRYHQLTGRQARKLESSSSSDLFLGFSSAVREVNPEIRDAMWLEFNQLAGRILQGMFSWVGGEFLFEDGSFPAQGTLDIPTGEILVNGIRNWIDFPFIHRRLLEGKCKIQLSSEFQGLLQQLPIGPAEAFLLFRFEHEIAFRELQDISGIGEEEFFRLIYLFYCAGILSIEQASTAQGPRKQIPVSALVTDQKTVREVTNGTGLLQPSENQSVLEGAQQLNTAAAPRPYIHDDAAQFYYRSAAKSFKNKNYWAAVEYCKKALELKKDAKCFRLMGAALATHPGFRHEAMDAYKQALELDPENIYIERDVADLYFVTGNFALARSKYEFVLRKSPKDEHSQKRLEELLKKKKK